MLKTEFGDRMFVREEERQQRNYDVGSSGLSNAFQKPHVVLYWLDLYIPALLSER